MKAIHKIPVLISIVCALLFAAVLGLLVFGQNALEMFYSNSRRLTDLLLLIPALLMGAGFAFAAGRSRRFGKKDLMATRILFLLTAVLQAVVVHCTWHHFGWDPIVVHEAAESIARGTALNEPEYFQLCPNNAPLTILQAVILKTGLLIGMSDPFPLLAYPDVLFLNCSAYLAVRCVDRLSENAVCHWMCTFLGIVMIALSPYLMYPYTDSYAILFPVAALYCRLSMKNEALRFGLPALLCAIGAAVKPTVWIVFIALILVEFLQLRKMTPRVLLQKGTAVLLAVVIGVLPGIVFTRTATADLTRGYEDQPQLAWTHYLMLGMNGQTTGGHSTQDVNYTCSFSTQKEARAANLAEAVSRVRGRSLWENVKFFVRKLYKAYSDGTFAVQQSFMPMEVPERGDALSLFLRRICYNDGDLVPLYQTVMQVLWLMILGLCTVCFFRMRGRKSVQIIALSLIGLTMYLLLFEVWPRYCFLYLPLFLIPAALAPDPFTAGIK